MKIELVMPGNTEESIKNGLLRLLQAASAVGVPLDGEAFARAWMSDNTRVFIATEEGKFQGFAIMAFGRRYYDAQPSSSILVAEGPARNQLLSFMVDTSRVLGSKVMYFEAKVDDELEGERLDMRRVEL